MDDERAGKPRVLFICKKRHTYGPGVTQVPLSSGLLNSATFVSDMLKVKSGMASKVYAKTIRVTT